MMDMSDNAAAGDDDEKLSTEICDRKIYTRPIDDEKKHVAVVAPMVHARQVKLQPAFDPKFTEEHLSLLQEKTEGNWSGGYLFQERQFTDDEMIGAYQMAIQEQRPGADPRCTERKGCVPLPDPTIQTKPFHIRNVKYAAPDLPLPSEMQELRKQLETRSLEDDVQARQERHMRRVRAAATKMVTEQGHGQEELVDPNTRKRQRRRVIK